MSKIQKPYRENFHAGAPEGEKMRVRTYNSQFVWMNYWGPEIRRNFRYLERGELISVPTHGNIFVQAGAIIPVSPRARLQRMGSAKGAHAMGYTDSLLPDQAVSLRPVPRKVYRQGSSSGSRVRYTNVTLGPQGDRKTVLVPYGRLVYLLRHPDMNASFPMSYEPVYENVGYFEQPAEIITVRWGNVNDLFSRADGIEVADEAGKLFSDMANENDWDIIPDHAEVTIKREGTPPTRVDLPKTEYSTWAPQNIIPTFIEPTLSFEKDYEEWELYLNGAGHSHYDNNYSRELEYFGFDKDM